MVLAVAAVTVVIGEGKSVEGSYIILTYIDDVDVNILGGFTVYGDVYITHVFIFRHFHFRHCCLQGHF